MKKLILSAVLFAGLTVSGFSQTKVEREHKTPQERAERVADMLDKKLSLSDSQRSQIYQISLERAQAMENFKDNKGSADRSQIKAQFEASENKILAVLNDSQKATYQQLKAERADKMKKHHGDKGGLRKK